MPAGVLPRLCTENATVVCLQVFAAWLQFMQALQRQQTLPTQVVSNLLTQYSVTLTALETKGEVRLRSWPVCQLAPPQH